MELVQSICNKNIKMQIKYISKEVMDHIKPIAVPHLACQPDFGMWVF